MTTRRTQTTSYKALRAFSYKPTPTGDYVDVAEGDKVTGLPVAVVKDLQNHHGEPVLAEVKG